MLFALFLFHGINDHEHIGFGDVIESNQFFCFIGFRVVYDDGRSVFHLKFFRHLFEVGFSLLDLSAANLCILGPMLLSESFDVTIGGNTLTVDENFTHWAFLYSALGLEAIQVKAFYDAEVLKYSEKIRDMEKECNKAVSCTHENHRLFDETAALKEKSAALVTLLETMISNASQEDLDQETFRRWIINAATHRLAAHKKE